MKKSKARGCMQVQSWVTQELYNEIDKQSEKLYVTKSLFIRDILVKALAKNEKDANRLMGVGR